MPELPEVETTRRKLEPLITRGVIKRITHQDPLKYRGTDLALGKSIASLGRRGKYLIMSLGGQDKLELIVHLGMTGGFKLEESKHTRVTLETDSVTLYFSDPRRFGKWAVVKCGEYRSMPTLANMGPEPLSSDFVKADFITAASKCGAVKTWLLSQRPVSGVGNIYADEALWTACIHPAQTRLTANQAAMLHEAICKIMLAAVNAGGSSLGSGVGNYRQHDGVSGLFQFQHNVYGKEARPCPRCETPINKMVLGQRGTHFCPRCQILKA